MTYISAYSPSFTSETRPSMKQRVKDNSTEMQIGGGAGVATFGTLSNSSRIGNSFVKAVKTSKNIKMEKQTQLLELAAKFKPLAKYVNSMNNE